MASIVATIFLLIYVWYYLSEGDRAMVRWFAARRALLAVAAGRASSRVEGPLMAKDRDAQLRNLITGYGDSIRLSDIKANIAVLFVAIMMGTVVGFRNSTTRAI